MLSLGLPSKKEQQYVLFDISSACIGVGIAVSSVNSVKLIWYKRFEYGYTFDDDYNRYVRTMYATLLEAGMKLTSEGFKEAKRILPTFSVKYAQVFCLLSPPWFMGSVQKETITKEKPFQVTQEIIKELETKGFSEILERQETKSWKDLMGTPVLLEAHHDSMLLEGYPVQKYEHATVNEISSNCYYSIVSESVQEHITEVIERVFPNHEIHTSTSARVFSSLCAKKSLQNRRQIVFEIGGEITGISLTKGGVLINTVTVPLGTNHILKVLAPKAQSAREAQGAFDMLFKKHSSNLEFESLPDSVRTALTAWKESVVKSIQALSKGVTPPSNVYVIVTASWYPLYKLALEIPWKMPGIQEIVDLNIQLLDLDVEKDSELNTEDVRLHMYACLLQSCTSKNSMCYTDNNK